MICQRTLKSLADFADDYAIPTEGTQSRTNLVHTSRLTRLCIWRYQNDIWPPGCSISRQPAMTAFRYIYHPPRVL